MAMQVLKDTFMTFGRTKEMNENYDHSRTGCAERVKEKQDVWRTEKEKEAEKVTEGERSGKLSEPQDEYISSEKPEEKPIGLYRVGQDGNGNRKIFFDAPEAVHSDEEENLKTAGNCPREGEDGKEPEISGDGQGKPVEKCVINTDKADREIKKLKEEKQHLEQQIRAACGNEAPFIRELEKRLAQVENELRQKDNDAYRRQNASVSE